MQTKTKVFLGFLVAAFLAMWLGMHFGGDGDDLGWSAALAAMVTVALGVVGGIFLVGSHYGA